MKQERINYSDIKRLEFKEDVQSDSVYFDEYGYDYVIITLDLTKKIYIDWAKETGFAKLIRIDNPKKCNIKKRWPIKNLKELESVIAFFEFFKDDGDMNMREETEDFKYGHIC